MPAAESDGSGEIIIKGGSCEIHFNDGVFDKDASEPGKQKHKHKKDVKIRRIVITGNKLFDKDNIVGGSFDSGDIAGGFKGEITISYKK